MASREELRVITEQIIPAYMALGPMSFAWAQGSVANGFTAEGDFDVILMWDLDRLPLDRAAVVATLGGTTPESAFVVNYRDINIDRFTMGGREYNIGHGTPRGFAGLIDQVRAGATLDESQILQPVVAVAGFLYGQTLFDEKGEAAKARSDLEEFPTALRSESQRVLNIRLAELPQIKEYAKRGDWIPFYSSLTTVSRAVLLTMYSERSLYFTGDKWVIAWMRRFGFPEQIVHSWEELWSAELAPDKRVDRLLALGRRALNSS